MNKALLSSAYITGLACYRTKANIRQEPRFRVGTENSTFVTIMLVLEV